MRKTYPKYDTCDLMHDGVCVSKPCICKGMARQKSPIEKADALRLGQRIIIDKKLQRRSKYIEKGEYKIKKEIKFWEEVKLREPIEGIIIGVRKLSNGENEWDSEIGNQYNPKEHFRAIIVAYKLSRKPIFYKL